MQVIPLTEHSLNIFQNTPDRNQAWVMARMNFNAEKHAVNLADAFDAVHEAYSDKFEYGPALYDLGLLALDRLIAEKGKAEDVGNLRILSIARKLDAIQSSPTNTEEARLLRDQSIDKRHFDALMEIMARRTLLHSRCGEGNDFVHYTKTGSFTFTPVESEEEVIATTFGNSAPEWMRDVFVPNPETGRFISPDDDVTPPKRSLLAAIFSVGQKKPEKPPQPNA